MAAFPVLIGDIGGTFARFAVLGGPGEPFRLLCKETTAAHPGPIAAMQAALQPHPELRPASVLLAVAGRIDGPRVHLTNANWMLDPEEIGRALGVATVRLLNDYAATAAGLTVLARAEPAYLTPIGTEMPRAGPQVVLGPGTGLGAAAVVPFGPRFVIHSTEAGHIEFGATEPGEARLWDLIDRRDGRISAEVLLSGSGLVRLYRALARAHRVEAHLAGPAEIVAAGRARTEAVARETLDLFAALLGRFAGDLALVFGATGGVFIAGGIAPRMVEVFAAGGFRAAFERKAPFEAEMRATPTALITHPEPVLLGLAALAAQPRRFLVHAVGWRGR